MNKFFHPMKSHSGSKKPPGKPPPEKMPEKTASWGGLPGKSQGRDFPGGAKKVKIHPKSEGI